jgi:hypothetical protein
MSIVVALALALHVAPSPHTTAPLGWLQEPEPQAGWDDPVDEPTETDTPVDGDLSTEEVAPTDPVPAPTPTVPPAQAIPQRPNVSKGTGLIVAASVTGGLAWVVGLTRMAIISRCARQIEDGELGDGSFGCIFRAGTASLILFPTQWTLNWATWGLAPAAGAIRGRYDGVAYAFDGDPDRSTGAFIGSGAALLGVGVIGRIAMYPMFGRALSGCVEDGAKCLTHLRLQAFGVQLSAAMIGGGAGLLAYGIAYNSSSKKYGRLLDEHALRIAPQVGLDYTGLALSGRF